jgi:hypothetical protein
LEVPLPAGLEIHRVWLLFAVVVALTLGGASLGTPASASANGGRQASQARLDAPRLGRTVRLRRVAGTVRIELPATRKYVPLRRTRNVPVSTRVDARRGKVKLTSARRNGGVQAGTFRGGSFRVSQKRSSLTVLVLIGGNFGGCSAPRVVRKRPSIRRSLHGEARGRFETRGRYSATIVAGTTWLTADRCDGTLTKVQKGIVQVKDLFFGTTVVVAEPGTPPNPGEPPPPSTVVTKPPR